MATYATIDRRLGHLLCRDGREMVDEKSLGRTAD
jgi:hypothetical protein